MLSVQSLGHADNHSHGFVQHGEESLHSVGVLPSKSKQSLAGRQDECRTLDSAFFKILSRRLPLSGMYRNLSLVTMVKKSLEVTERLKSKAQPTDLT
ncbi:hypothetical protein HG530_008502 [Fusarium avenaceum]|nr:hypothetical protein HG530_008502 [Fusarium avenaceum]